MDGNLLGTNNLERAIAPSVRTGHLIGAVQAAKVAEGYREGLECGVVGLLQSELSPEALEAARADGVALAAAQLEERRRPNFPLERRRARQGDWRRRVQ